MTGRWPEPGRFRAVAVELDPAHRPDPLAVAGPEGLVVAGADGAVAGRGVAVRLELGPGWPDAAPGVAGWLAAVPGADGASGPVAVGGLPFRRDRPGSLVVPRLTVLTGPGRAVAVAVGPAEGPPPDPRRRLADLTAAHVARRAAHHPPAWRADPPEARFVAAVGEALAAIDAGRVDKVVLARRVEATFDADLDVASVLARLHAGEPAATVFGVPAAGGTFVGASPEVLVRRRGTEVVSHPLAGTVALPGRPAADDQAAAALFASAKDRLEHRLVVEAVAATLRPRCTRLEVPAAPEVLRLSRVAHLGTRLAGRLRSPAPDALTLAAVLHPTPAVAGTPRDVAVALVGELEGAGRGPYAGPVGWVDAGGDGEFVVGIRSALLAGRVATVFAGAGIVAGSDPEQELAETTMKLGTALAALGG